MRIGVFGGTFDPVHLGHLLMAEQSREQAALDQVWFLPSARPPHKMHRPMTPFGRRVEMLALAVAGHSAFRIEELEKDRPGLSYTADTLDELARLHPSNEWFLIVGSDTLIDLPHWHDPARVIGAAGILVVARPGSPIVSADELRVNLALPPDSHPRIQAVAMPLIDIASSDLRRRAGEGRSLRYFVSRSVECYIQAKDLYHNRGLVNQ
jgi:nicotinate-nucleotide adenylyltransferase